MKERISRLCRKRVATVSAVAVAALLCGCSRAQTKAEPELTPDVRIDLSAQGLPKGFFRSDADTKCAGQIIGYRFVVWLNSNDVAVGFNTSPNCKVEPDRTIDGLARILIFGVGGVLKAKRDIPYLADGNGELVAQGEARPGPGGTLLFRIESSISIKKVRGNRHRACYYSIRSCKTQHDLIAFCSRRRLWIMPWSSWRDAYPANEVLT